MNQWYKGLINNAVIIQRNAHYESGKDIYLSISIDLLIFKNFYSITFFSATRILRVIGCRLYDSQPIFDRFFGIKKKKENKNLLNKYKIN